MFETMGQFCAFFIPTLVLIILGIIFEEKLVRFERKVFSALILIFRKEINNAQILFKKMGQEQRQAF